MQYFAVAENFYRDDYFSGRGARCGTFVKRISAAFTAALDALEWRHVSVSLPRLREHRLTVVCMDETTKDNADALTRAYDQWADAIYRHCYFRVFRRERAEEIMQETFIKAWHYIVKGNDVKNLRALLYRIANNLIIDESRKKKEVSLEALQESGLEFGYDSKRRLETNVEAENVLETLKGLRESYRNVIIMRYVDELEPEEIAAITGESANVVSVRLHRAIKEVRETFLYDEVI